MRISSSGGEGAVRAQGERPARFEGYRDTHTGRNRLNLTQRKVVALEMTATLFKKKRRKMSAE